MARVRGTQIYSPEILEELKTAMSEHSREGEDDEITFKQKMNALQRFLNHGMSRFSIDVWHHSLSTLCHAWNHHHHDNSLIDADDGKAVIRKLKGVADLRGLSRDVIMQREGGTIREADTQALKHLDNFMSALQCVREAKSCIAEMYRFLYRYYFDPDAGREATTVRSANPLSRAHTLNPAPGLPDHVNPYESSAKQFGILTLQQMSGSTGHKLRRTVSDMQHILQRWDRLMAVEGEISPDDLDAESQQDLLLLTGTSAFEPVLRLLPDIFAKYYKCLELVKQWWVLAHEIYPELPIGRSPTPSTLRYSRESTERSSSRESRVSTLSSSAEESVPYSEQLSNVAEDIQLSEDLLLSLAEEMKLLEVRERHFESLMEAYEKVTAELGDKTRERKELVAFKEKESFLPNNQMLDPSAKQNFAASSDSRLPQDKNLNDVSEQVDRADREIKMLQFQQSLLRQDYMLQLEIRPSLIRFADDLRIRTQGVQKTLTEQKMEQVRLQILLQEGNKSNNIEDVKVPTPRQEIPSENTTYVIESRNAFVQDNTGVGKQSKSKPHADKSRVQNADSSPRSKQEDEERSDTPDSSSQPLNASQTTAPKKVVERKMSELSRLHAKPLREDTSGSSLAPDSETTSLPAPETRRKKSLPDRQAELRSRKSVPLLKVSKPAENAASVDNAGPAQTKSGKATTAQARGPASSPRPPQKPPANGTTTANSTEALFQRRSVKQKKREENPRGEEEHSDDRSIRPRSKSDPHALKPRQRTLKPVPETGRSLSSAETEKADPVKEQSKGNGESSSARSKPKETRKDSDSVSRDTKPPAVVRRDTDPVQKQKPVDNKATANSSQKQTPGAARKENDTNSQKPKADDPKKGTTSQSSKSGDTKQDNTAKSRVTNADDDARKSTDATSHKFKPNDKTSQKPKVGDGRKESLAASQTSKARDDQAKSDAASLQKPREKNGDITETTLSAPRPKEGEDKMQTRKSPRDTKGGENKRNPKAADLKKDAKSSVTEPKRDSKTTSHPNGVIRKGQKQSYSNE